MNTTTEDLISLIKSASETGGPIDLLYGTIADVSAGHPTITYDGEDAPSVYQHPYLGSYVPTVGDRVAVVKHNQAAFVLGKLM